MTGDISKIFDENRKEERKHLFEPEVEWPCMKSGTPVTCFEVTKNADETVRLADETGYPSVLKTVFPDFVRRLPRRSCSKPQMLKGCRRALRRIPGKVKMYKPNEKIAGAVFSRTSLIQQMPG